MGVPKRHYHLWTDEEERWLRQHYDQPAADLVSAYAKAFPHKPRRRKALKAKCVELGLRISEASKKAALASRPDTQRRLAWEAIPRYDQFSRLAGDFAICSDLHVPKLDPTMWEGFLHTAKRHKLAQCMVLGDFFDQEEFSSWAISGLQPSAISFGQEVGYAVQVLEDLLTHFDRVFCLRGNHDDRILRLLRFALGLSDVFAIVGRRVALSLQRELANKLQVSEYPFCHVGGNWLCAHPSTYSRIPGAVARDVAEVEGMNTVMGNGHLLSMSRDKSDRYWAVDSGCLVDPQKVYYKVFKVRRFPKWSQGFVLLRKGQPILVHREHLAVGMP